METETNTNTEQVNKNQNESTSAEQPKQEDGNPSAAPVKTFTEDEVNKLVAEKLSEAEKLRKMNAEQKAAYEKEQLDKKLAEREKAVTERELRATAKETLVSKGLPASLSDCLDYTDAEKCNKSIESVSKAFNEAVANAVNDRLRQSAPKAADNNTSAKDSFLEGLGL